MKVTFSVTLFFTAVYGAYSESLCSQMGGKCNSYYDVCFTGKYSYKNHLCSRYGEPPVCCFYVILLIITWFYGFFGLCCIFMTPDYWDNDCIRRGGTCFDIRFSSCTNGRTLNDGCGGDYKYCCAPNYLYPTNYNQRSSYNRQYYNSQTKTYPYSQAHLYHRRTSYNGNPVYSNTPTARPAYTG